MKSGKRVFRDLYENHWANDTLAPLSLQKYEKMADGMLVENETAYSALLGIANTLKLSNQDVLILATDKNIKIGRQNGDFRYKTLTIPLVNVRSIELLQDSKNKHRYYAVINYRISRFGYLKGLRLEVFDPTSAFHFQEYVENKIH